MLPNKARNKCSGKTVPSAPRVSSTACAEPNTSLYTIPTVRNTQYATYFYEIFLISVRQKDVATGSTEDASASHIKLHSASNLGNHILI